MELKKMAPIELFRGEEFKEVFFPEKRRLRYAISNKGRFISFVASMDFGRILEGTLHDGYRMASYTQVMEGKTIKKTLYFSRLVATYFCEKTSENQIFVIHLDYVRDNDHYKNLKWATLDELQQHINRSPAAIASRAKLVEHNRQADGKKLTVMQVIRMKKMLVNPKRNRIKMIAKQFKVSQTHIFRIQSGENWGHIKI